LLSAKKGNTKMENLEIRKISGASESRLQQNKRDLEKTGRKEIPPKEEKYLNLNQYFVTGDSSNWTITYAVPEQKGNIAKPF
jgi:hypothetical protein